MPQGSFIPPDQLYGDLFVAVQKQRIFPDSKTFVDCRAKREPNSILQDYAVKKNEKKFRLKDFVLENFEMPKNYASGFTPDPGKKAHKHVMSLWDILTRQSDEIQEPGSSLIPLPHPYIVPGGRFGEIYYWDSYFTMLGLAVSGRIDMIENMIRNFAHLIDLAGFIPNGNRTYFLTRSQPPFFALMVQLLCKEKGEQVLSDFLPQLLKEYRFWMDGLDKLNTGQPDSRRVVLLEDNVIMNRHWDDTDIPRQESYLEDVELAIQSNRNPAGLYREIRAACESGWDFSSRWFEDGKSLSKIQTTEIIPVDLNCLLYYLESTIGKAFHVLREEKQSLKYESLAEKRSENIREKLWDPGELVFQDYNFRKKKFTGVLSLAMVYPLFFGISTPAQAEHIAEIVENKFLKKGGLIPTLYHTGEQWDAPNGWPPLQWMAVKGLKNYGHEKLANEIARRWVDLCEKVYEGSTRFVEKYNVEDIHLKAGGGEYPVQDGFGWSNGVYLRMMKTLERL